MTLDAMTRHTMDRDRIPGCHQQRRFPLAALPCALVAAALLAGAAGPARAAQPCLEGEIHALALAGDRLLALRDGDAWLLTAGGRVLGALAAPGRGATAEPTRTPRRRPSADDVVDLLGIPDDDLDSDAVRDALEDEGIRPARRGRDPRGDASDARAGDARDAGHAGARTGAGAAKTLAASRDAIWIADRGAVARLDARDPAAGPGPGAPVTTRRRALAALAVTADGHHLAAIADHDVVRSHDGGRTWSLLAGLPTRARAVALSPEGDDTFVADEDGVAVVAHRERFAIFDGQAQDIAWCGDELLIAGADAIFAWRWTGGLERRGDRPAARRLACAAAAPDLVLEYGPDLSVSRDGGRTWNQRAHQPAQEIESVAIAANEIWIGAANGLYQLPIDAAVAAQGADLDAGAVVAGVAGGAPARAAARGLTLGVMPALRAAGWHGLLPRISLVGMRTSTRPGGDRGAIWLLLTFPLERGRPDAPRAARLAADLLHQRAAAAVALARAARSESANDEESQALARLARDQLDQLDQGWP